MPVTPKKSPSSKRLPGSNFSKSKRKEDALALARLLYDIFKEQQNNGKVENGQNYANRAKD
jgi:hypothetical protein